MIPAFFMFIFKPMRSCFLGILFITVTFAASASALQDTVRISKSQILITTDSVYAPEKDTFYIVHSDYKIRKNPYTTSDEFYKNVKQKTGKNFITAKLFDLLYSPQDAKHLKPIDVTQHTDSPFEPYKGLRITQIHIKHVDILEGNVNDTTVDASSYIAKTANNLHINTWNSVIRNYLRVKKGQQIRPLVLADDERMLRRLQFIEDARVHVHQINEEEAELIIVVKDRFAWGFTTDLNSYDKFHFGVFNRNMGGIGKYASATWFYTGGQNPPNGYEFKLGAQNIEKSAINWELDNINDGDRESWGAVIEKDFVTPNIRWIGGVELRVLRDSTLTLDGEEKKHQYYNLTFEDLWLGHAFKIHSRRDRKNLIFSARYLHNYFKDRPMVSADSNQLYYNRQLVLGEISFTGQRFTRTNYVVGLGVTEDIPLGFRFSLIGGRDFNEYSAPNYYAFQFFWSFYLKRFGYLLIDDEMGRYKGGNDDAGVINTSLTYFSPLVTVGRYYVRNFMTINYIHGVDQPYSNSIYMENYIRDLNQEKNSGNSLLALSVESVLYTPWYFYGFKFAPFFYYNIGELSESRNGNFATDYGYSGMGGGFRIRNASLLIKSLEFRFTYFPSNPDSKDYLISFSTTVPISFENFFKFKPKIIPFN